MNIRKKLNSDSIIRMINRHKEKAKRKLKGNIGDFYRAGGNDLLSEAESFRGDMVAVDCGGYHGAWTRDMLLKYGCEVHVYEPFPDFYRILCDQYGRNGRVAIYEEGVSSKCGEARISVEDNASSMYGGGGDHISIQLVGIADVIERAGGKIGCLKMNIEGAEYEIIEEMASAGLHEAVETIIVQFHTKVPDYEKRYSDAQAYLGKHYTPIRMFGRLWQIWQLK